MRTHVSAPSVRPSVRPLPIVTWAQFVYLEWEGRDGATTFYLCHGCKKRDSFAQLLPVVICTVFVGILLASPQKEWGHKVGNARARSGFIASKSWVASGVGVCFGERVSGPCGLGREREKGRFRADKNLQSISALLADLLLL